MEKPEVRESSSSVSDTVAVSELISDIEGEVRLHQVRIQEFLEGTNEFAAVTDNNARARLQRTQQILKDVLTELAEIAA